ncbi:MAG TPA: antibiotic biosynthesis monooxygenase [Solirubrobacteraceae bacterium]|nr:antibiotic biosynthesis monooxygenase [Solirubrobacteraceae bacterium]
MEVILGVGDVYVQVPHRQVAERAMVGAREHALTQEGCLGFVFAEVLGDPGHFVVVESWSDEQAVQRHYNSAGYADYQREISGLLVRDSEYRLHVVDETLHPVDSPAIVTDQDD